MYSDGDRIRTGWYSDTSNNRMYQITITKGSTNYVTVGGFKAGTSITPYFKLYYR